MGKAINKAVTIAEILKRKMPLHQITALSSCEIVNVYEPLEEGLDRVVNQHYVSCLTITLSTDSSDVDVRNIGYQVSSQKLTRHVYHLDCTLTFISHSLTTQPPLSLNEMQPGDLAQHTGKIVAAS